VGVNLISHGLKMMNRVASLILALLLGICEAVVAIGYAVPATSIGELTRTDIALWMRLMDATLMWTLAIGAIYMAFRILRVGPKSK
jgi:hypothetical protein